MKENDPLYNGLMQVQNVDLQLTVRTVEDNKTSYKLIVGDPTKKDGMDPTKVGKKVIYKGMFEKIDPGYDLEVFKKKFTGMKTLQDLVEFLEEFQACELPPYSDYLILQRLG